MAARGARQGQKGEREGDAMEIEREQEQKKREK